MSFELLDYAIASVSSYYEVGVHIEDKSKRTVQLLTASCRAMYRGVKSYYETAIELCAYNEETESFNAHFADGVTALYEDEPASAPWYQAPLTFVMHQDLIYDSHGGDLESIVKAAADITQQIDPINGTLEALENFRMRYEEFIINVYGTTPSDKDGLHSITIGEMPDSVTNIYYNQLTIPSPTMDGGSSGNTAVADPDSIPTLGPMK